MKIDKIKKIRRIIFIINKIKAYKTEKYLLKIKLIFEKSLIDYTKK